MKEREYRSANLVITGAPDNNTSNATASLDMGAFKEKDLEYVQSLINKMPIDDHIHKLKNMLSAGPDEIPSSLVKKCATSLVLPVLTIFNKSLEQGQFALEWG